MSKAKGWMLSKEQPHGDLQGLSGAAKKDISLDWASPRLNKLLVQTENNSRLAMYSSLKREAGINC